MHAVIGTVVLTEYNNNTYRIEDVDFTTSPTDSFLMKNGDSVTYEQYYSKKYGISIRQRGPPLLVAKSRMKGRLEAERIFLLPELCRATGTLCLISGSKKKLLLNFTIVSSKLIAREILSKYINIILYYYGNFQV